MHTVRDIIKKLRAAGLSQDEIARRSRISQPTLSKWESRGAAKGADAALRLVALEQEIASQATQDQGGACHAEQ